MKTQESPNSHNRPENKKKAESITLPVFKTHNTAVVTRMA